MTDAIDIVAFSHLGFAVASIQEFRDTWGNALGMADWLVHHESIESGFQLHGEPTGPVSAEVAFAKCGGLVFELIETQSGRTHHSDHIEAHGPGLHHVGFWVRNLAAELEKVSALGLEVVMAPPDAPAPLAGRPVSAVVSETDKLPDLGPTAAAAPLVAFFDTTRGNTHFALELLDINFAIDYQGLNTFDPYWPGTLPR
jgi:Glyoxalase/Bleomycin resistance protein/Dioxygenase superfamily